MPFFSFPAQVNERAARLVASVVAAALLAALITRTPLIVPVVALGFLLRAGWGPRFSPLARGAMALAPHLWETRPVSGPPKRFAQGIGAVCTVAASALFALSAPAPAWGLVALVVLFATLESTLGFCMGCWLYARLQAAGLVAPDACVDCVRR